MNATDPRTFPDHQSSRPRHSAPTRARSKPDLSAQNFDAPIPLHAIDGHEFRAFFTDKLSEFLQANFRNPEAVAAAFGVRFSTATNWWNGDNRASGDVVARMFVCLPQAQAWFMQEWQDR